MTAVVDELQGVVGERKHVALINDPEGTAILELAPGRVIWLA